jgi:hypothetical protein
MVKKSAINYLNMHEFGSFIFTHIPKCGGSSFRFYLNRCAISSGIKEENIHIPGCNGISNNKNLDQLNEIELIELRKRKIKVLADHSYFMWPDKINVLLDNPFRFTILREPIDRFISHYNFFNYRHGNQDCKGITLQELPIDKFRWIVTMLANVQTYHVAGCHARDGINRNIVLEIAKYNLQNKFHYFGLIEKMSTSLDGLQEFAPIWLRLTEYIEHLNQNKLNYELDCCRLDYIRSINDLDLRLYHFAVKIFDKYVF